LLRYFFFFLAAFFFAMEVLTPFILVESLLPSKDGRPYFFFFLAAFFFFAMGNHLPSLG
jgi:hypothetical protein